MLRPARECRCRTVPVIIPSTRTTIPTIMAGHPRARPAAGQRHAPAAARAEDGYTLVHAGKQVRFGPVVFWIVVGTVDRARHVVGGDRDLFRVSRRRADAADRPPGRDAIRLRGPHRRIARQGRPHHQPPVARPGTVRPEARPDHAAPDRARIARHRARRHPGRVASPDRSGRRRGAPRPTNRRLPARRNRRRSAIP